MAQINNFLFSIVNSISRTTKSGPAGGDGGGSSYGCLPGPNIRHPNRRLCDGPGPPNPPIVHHPNNPQPPTGEGEGGGRALPTRPTLRRPVRTWGTRIAPHGRRGGRGIGFGGKSTALLSLDFGRRKSVTRAQRRGTTLKPDTTVAMATAHSKVRCTTGAMPPVPRQLLELRTAGAAGIAFPWGGGGGVPLGPQMVRLQCPH